MKRFKFFLCEDCANALHAKLGWGPVANAMPCKCANPQCEKQADYAFSTNVPPVLSHQIFKHIS